MNYFSIRVDDRYKCDRYLCNTFVKIDAVMEFRSVNMEKKFVRVKFRIV